MTRQRRRGPITPPADSGRDRGGESEAAADNTVVESIELVTGSDVALVIESHSGVVDDGSRTRIWSERGESSGAPSSPADDEDLFGEADLFSEKTLASLTGALGVVPVRHAPLPALPRLPLTLDALGPAAPDRARASDPARALALFLREAEQASSPCARAALLRAAARAAERQGDAPRAIALHERAVTCDPASAASYRALARLGFASGAAHAALEALSQLSLVAGRNERGALVALHTEARAALAVRSATSQDAGAKSDGATTGPRATWRDALRRSLAQLEAQSPDPALRTALDGAVQRFAFGRVDRPARPAAAVSPLHALKLALQADDVDAADAARAALAALAARDEDKVLLATVDRRRAIALIAAGRAAEARGLLEAGRVSTLRDARLLELRALLASGVQDHAAAAQGYARHAEAEEEPTLRALALRSAAEATAHAKGTTGAAWARAAAALPDDRRVLERAVAALLAAGERAAADELLLAHAARDAEAADLLRGRAARLRGEATSSAAAPRPRASVLGERALACWADPRALGDTTLGALDALLVRDGAAPRVARASYLAHARREDHAGAAAALLARAEAIGERREATALRYEAAWHEAARGASAEAALLLERVVEAEPEFAAAWDALESLARASADATALAELLSRRWRATDRSATTPFRIAFLARRAALEEARGEPARAARLVGEALDLAIGDPLLRQTLERVCGRAGDYSALVRAGHAELARLEAEPDGGGARAARLEAHEELARIDGELRSDSAAAVLALEAALALAPDRVAALWALHAIHAAEGAHVELAGVHARLAVSARGTEDAAALFLLAARHERLSGTAGAGERALELLRAAADTAPGDRAVLFHLEAHARSHGPQLERLELERQVAELFVADGPAHAAYLALSAENAPPGPDPAVAEAALNRLAAAAALDPGSRTIQRALGRLALAAGHFPEASDAIEAEAALASSATEQARLLELAGGVAMTRAADLPRATLLFAAAFALDPTRDASFLRARALLGAGQRHADVARLLARRLDVETWPRRRVELLLAQAALLAGPLGDAEGASRSLDALLRLEPSHLAAARDAAELALARGAWREAEAALVRVVRLEPERGRRAAVLGQLGALLAHDLAEPARALAPLEQALELRPDDVTLLETLATAAEAAGKPRIALDARERLAARATGPSSRVPQLLRASRAREALGELPRAGEQVRQALELAPSDVRALTQLADFFERRRDLTGLRIQLDRAIAALTRRTTADACDGEAWRALATALSLRVRAGVAASEGTARAAAVLACALGAGGDEELALAKGAATPAGLASLFEVEGLIHPALGAGARNVLALLEEPLDRLHPLDLRRFGLTKRDALSRTAPLARLAEPLARALGLADVAIYVCAQDPLALVAAADGTIVLGSALAEPSREGEARFVLGRALAAARLGAATRLGVDELAALLCAAVRLVEPQFNPPGVAADLAADATVRLGKLVARRTRDELRPFVPELTQSFEPRSLHAGLLQTTLRGGLLAAGDLRDALAVLTRLHQGKSASALLGLPVCAELARFATSEEHREALALVHSA